MSISVRKKKNLVFLFIFSFLSLFAHFSSDWEFPGDVNQGADVNSKENFNHLVNEFRSTVEAEAEAAGKRKLLITSAVPADPKKIDSGYFVSNLCKKLDYVIFDLHI